jgi:hypothetical protein
MPVPQDQRRPQVKESVSDRQIKTGGDPANFDKETIGWQFFRLDHNHAHWGWDKLRPQDWRDILRHLVDFEGMTWADIKAQAGGRRRGTNHHPIEIAGFNKSARDRLEELHLDDYESLFSLRINNTLRLYGVRDGRVLQIVWHDPHHGSTRGACPVQR